MHAMKWLDRPENANFYADLRSLTLRGYTVNLEWCAPQHRIVIGYEKPHLTVLNIRDNASGEYIELDDVFVAGLPTIVNNYVERVNTGDNAWFAAMIPQMDQVEGYVVRFKNGQRVKIKTAWYLALHHTKDSINSPRRLFEAVLEEATDDMRSMFHDDPLAIKMIEEMEVKVDEIYNHVVDSVERFYERNKDLERKEYAILGQKELERKVFGLAMTKYLGKDVDYKAWMKKHYRDFGIKDEINDQDSD